MRGNCPTCITESQKGGKENMKEKLKVREDRARRSNIALVRGSQRDKKEGVREAISEEIMTNSSEMIKGSNSRL